MKFQRYKESIESREIPEFLKHDKDIQESGFLTEDTGTGDVTVPVIFDYVCSVLAAVIISLGIIMAVKWVMYMITGVW